MVNNFLPLFQECEINRLKKQIEEFKERISLKGNPIEEGPELTKLVTENIKLKHRLAILNKVI